MNEELSPRNHSKSLRGLGAEYPFLYRIPASLSSILANYRAIWSEGLHGRMGLTYETFALDDAVLHPKAIASHQVRHHDIGEQAVTNDGDLVW